MNKYKTHPFKHKQKECAICGKNTKLESHHISYEKDICITLCKNHHGMVHKKIHKNHPLATKDKRMELIVKINNENTKLLRRYCSRHFKNHQEAVNYILENQLCNGNFEFTSNPGKPYSRLISWDDFKKIGGSFLMKEPMLLFDFLESLKDFSKMQYIFINNAIDKWRERTVE